MDPNTALANLLDGLSRKDAWMIEDACEALRSWIASGGFIPELPAEVAAVLVAAR